MSGEEIQAILDAITQHAGLGWAGLVGGAVLVLVQLYKLASPFLPLKAQWGFLPDWARLVATLATALVGTVILKLASGMTMTAAIVAGIAGALAAIGANQLKKLNPARVSDHKPQPTLVADMPEFIPPRE